MTYRSVFCLAGILCFAVVGRAEAGQPQNSEEPYTWYGSVEDALPDIENRYGSLIRKESARYQIPHGLLASIIAVESLGNPDVEGGLMQVSPIAAKAVGIHCDTQQPACSIQQGAAYLRHLQDRYALSWPRTILAYNRGPTAVKNIMQVRTYEYVQRVSFAMNNGTRLASN